MVDRIHFSTIVAKYNIPEKDFSTTAINAVMFELFGNEKWYASAGFMFDGSIAAAANAWVVKSDLFDVGLNGGFYYKKKEDFGVFAGFEIRF